MNRTVCRAVDDRNSGQSRRMVDSTICFLLLLLFVDVSFGRHTSSYRCENRIAKIAGRLLRQHEHGRIANQRWRKHDRPHGEAAQQTTANNYMDSVVEYKVPLASDRGHTHTYCATQKPICVAKLATYAAAHMRPYSRSERRTSVQRRRSRRRQIGTKTSGTKKTAMAGARRVTFALCRCQHVSPGW